MFTVGLFCSVRCLINLYTCICDCYYVYSCNLYLLELFLFSIFYYFFLPFLGEWILVNNNAMLARRHNLTEKNAPTHLGLFHFADNMTSSGSRTRQLWAMSYMIIIICHLSPL